MRPPGNVLYLVDNLWEWKRPKNFPNRRLSVFASPQADLAKSFGPEGGTVYQVKFEGKFKLCQVVGYADSKNHPDCKSLRKLIFRILGQEWIDGKLDDKEDVGKLWIPCLTKSDINYLFGVNQKLRSIREEVYNSIRYWDDVVLVRDGKLILDEEGESFFEPLEGYRLKEITD